MKSKIVSFLVVINLSAFCNAQQAVNTAGGEASGAGGNVSYSYGQVAYTSNSEIEGTVSQGVQQPYEIYVITSNEVGYKINLELSVYPNPAREYVKLTSVNYEKGNLTYQLYDVNGTLLESKKLDDPETYIQMDKFISSVYFLKVTDYHKEIKTFKIIKN